MRSAFTCLSLAFEPPALPASCRWLVVFFGMALLLPPLPFRLGNTGPHLALLAAAAGVWIGVRRFSEWRWESDALTVALLTLFSILLASVAMAALYSGAVIAVGSLARVLLFGISVYVFLYLRDGPGAASSVQPSTLIRVMFWAAVASALFACIDFYFRFPAPAGFSPQFLGLVRIIIRRAQGVFYDAGALGNVCAFFLEMIAVSLLSRTRDLPGPSPAVIIGGVVLACALTLSFSRGSLLNLVVALVVLLCLERRRIKLRLLAGVALVAGAAAAVLHRMVPVFASIYWHRILASLQNFTHSPDQVLSGRLKSWSMLGDFVLAHPGRALLGIGYKTLPYSGITGTPVIADNTYLSALVETGVFGLGAVIFLNVAILRAAYRVSKSAGERSSLGAWMFCFWAGQCVQMLTVDLLTYWRVLPLYFCVLALATQKEPGEYPVP